MVFTPISVVAANLATAITSSVANTSHLLLQVVERTTTPIPIVVEGTSETAQCNSDEVVTGGGYSLSTAGPPHDIVIDSNHKDSSVNGWTVIATNFSQKPQTQFLQTYAECARIIS